MGLSPLNIDVRALILAEGFAGFSLLLLFLTEKLRCVPKPFRVDVGSNGTVNWSTARLLSSGAYIAVLIGFFLFSLRRTQGQPTS